MQEDAQGVRHLIDVATSKQSDLSLRGISSALRARERACEATAGYLRQHVGRIGVATELLFERPATKGWDPVALGMMYGIARVAVDVAFSDANYARRSRFAWKSCRAGIMKATRDRAAPFAPRWRSSWQPAESFISIYQLLEEVGDVKKIACDAKEMGSAYDDPLNVTIAGVMVGLTRHLPDRFSDSKIWEMTKRRRRLYNWTHKAHLPKRSGREIEAIACFKKRPTLEMYDPAHRTFDLYQERALCAYIATCSDVEMLALLGTMPVQTSASPYGSPVSSTGVILIGAAHRWARSSESSDTAKVLPPDCLAPALHKVCVHPLQRKVVDLMLFEITEGARRGDSAEMLVRRLDALGEDARLRLSNTWTEQLAIWSVIERFWIVAPS